LELREQLIQKGCQFRSPFNTEDVLALNESLKEECPQNLDVVFSFAIWNEREETLFAAVDRFGEKPVFIARTLISSFSARK
jgi:asparagine synthase (glutamine-hydrolysing)